MAHKIQQAFHRHYYRRLEAALALTLLVIIALFLLFPRFEVVRREKIKFIGTAITVEEIPVTRQIGAQKPPVRPAVPIPSDDITMPEDITIDDTELDLSRGSSIAGSGLIFEPVQIIQPRPLFEVIPEYPEELQKKGIEGTVKLSLHIDANGSVINVIVIENSTGSEACANAARVAALKGRYIPAKKDGQPTDLWITRTYTFGLQK